MADTHLTQLAGQAVAEALTEIAINGLRDNPRAAAALLVADIIADAAIKAGATLTDIRRASGLIT